ncbi:hypothetical protein EPUS_08603 [Endocarpon pusillum Z07020]|uniref:Mid2 domain-containing protein n=1 Tax=Endocarpon pusillum (strain Z07020 / HMAS-L-300199) TaxID=1263415 RepID=U1HUP4_ENDPU|nr:uncharacterized protein EPUS_08603 [Endocarpon pusillum Z07020]ERF73039.1 hypothetical protein EPUS_08603 [Endocarpon pusillum Z07020]
MTVQQTATYRVERSVKEFNHAAELATIVSEPMLVMVTKVSSTSKSFSNPLFCLLQIVGMVYTAGCTDESYGSSRCPSKCNSGKSLGQYIAEVTADPSRLLDAYWVGHSYCNGTSNQWSCCDNQFGDSSNNENFPFFNGQPCWCPEENANIAFAAPSKIPDIANLVLDQPGRISYFPGQAPSMTINEPPNTNSNPSTSSDFDSPTTAAADQTQITRITVSPSATNDSPARNTASPSHSSSTSQTPIAGSPASPPITPSKDPSLSTDSKIGIGVGVGVGALILAALAWLLLSFLRKRRQKAPPPIEHPFRPKSYGSYAGISDAHSRDSTNGDLRSPAWSGHKPELPADERAVVAPRDVSMIETT